MGLRNSWDFGILLESSFAIYIWLGKMETLIIIKITYSHRKVIRTSEIINNIYIFCNKLFFIIVIIYIQFYSFIIYNIYL